MLYKAVLKQKNGHNHKNFYFLLIVICVIVLFYIASIELDIIIVYSDQ